jgi:hypothetical protein
MPRRHPFRAVAILAVAMGAAAAAGCAGDGTPRRVPDDGAPCAATMPGPVTSSEGSLRLGDVAITEQSWVRQPPRSGAEPAADAAGYAVRRGRVPAGSPLRDGALLDAAAARATKGVALQDGTKPTVAKVATSAGEAVDLRWTTGALHHATRFHLIPGGYCEVTILGARADADIDAYFGSVRLRP